MDKGSSPPGDGAARQDSLGFLTGMTARLLARLLHERMQLHGTAVGHWPLLGQLWQRDGMAQGELGRQVGIEPATLTRTLDRMERDGLVERRRNAADRREVLVFLTPRGRALRDVLVPEAAAVMEAAVEGLSPAEVAELKRMLHHIICRLTDRGYTPVWAALPGSGDND